MQGDLLADVSCRSLLQCLNLSLPYCIINHEFLCDDGSDSHQLLAVRSGWDMGLHYPLPPPSKPPLLQSYMHIPVQTPSLIFHPPVSPPSLEVPSPSPHHTTLHTFFIYSVTELFPRKRCSLQHSTALCPPETPPQRTACRWRGSALWPGETRA